MASPFFAWETVESLMQKQRQNKVVTKRAKELIMKLQHLVNYFSKDSSRVELQLRQHFQSTMPHSSPHQQNLLSLPSDTNSGITESTYDTMNNYDTMSNKGFVNNGQTRSQQDLVYPRLAESSSSRVNLQNGVDGNILQEKGKLLNSVVDAGSLPMWLQPSSQGQQHINYDIPPLTIEDFDMVDMGTCVDLQENPFQDSMLNFGGLRSDSWMEGHVSGTKRQRLT